jgi:hypothetical protein
MAQYADKLSVGVKTMIEKEGFSLKVYPTHRTAAAPQQVYDFIAANVGRAQLNPGGGRLGFTGGYGGAPFPIPDTSDPLVAGAQIIWNHLTRWNGYGWTYRGSAWTVQSGQLQLSSDSKDSNIYPYYDPNGSVETFKGYADLGHTWIYNPATSTGTEVVYHYGTNPRLQPNILWELLQGQGRVRKAPELAYDTPSQYNGDICNYDEEFGFNGSPDRYDWKYVGKKEMLIPYNNNKMRRTPVKEAHLKKFLNPDVVRWELHRVWVVEATLHPGQRNVLARRTMYVDEDTWMLSLSDGYDASGNIYHANMVYNICLPNVPGTILLNVSVHNVQTGDYTTIIGPWGDAPYNKPWIFGPINPAIFEPQVMAAAAAY